MARLNTEYIAKLQRLNEKIAKLRTDAAVFKEQMQKQEIATKKLDEID